MTGDPYSHIRLTIPSGDPYNHVGERAVPKNVVKLGAKMKPAPLPSKEWGAWERIRKIARLAGWNPAIRIDPVQVAASTLEKAKAGRIKSILVSIEWDDESFSTDWCQMPRRCLLGHAFNIQTTVQDEIKTS